MGRLKKLARVGILLCLMIFMTGVFSLYADAANVQFMVSNITQPNFSATVEDGKAYFKKLEPSVGYKLPILLVITTSEGTALAESDYTYSPATGDLEIHADHVYGNLTVLGAAVALKPIDTPSVEGAFVVYETLKAKVFPEGATVTYQWYRKKDGNNIAIAGANSASYTLTKEDIGAEINVEVAGTGDYYEKKFSTTNTIIAKKGSTSSPARTDVTITNVAFHGGNNGGISSNTDRILEYYNTEKKDWDPLPAQNKTAGEYQIRYKETEDTLASQSTIVRIFEPCASPVPTDVTITHLTVAGANTGKMISNTSKVLEYYDGTSWNSFPATGLKAGKYQVRFAETTDYLESAPYNFFVMEPTTKVVKEQDVIVTHVPVRGAAAGAIRPGDAVTSTMEVQVDGVWKTLPIQTLKAGTYQVRYAATDTTFPSGSCKVVVKEPADVPIGIQITDVTTHGGNNGAFSGLKTTWQVSYDGTTWHDCSHSSLNGLSAGTYYFRTKESTSHLASEAVSYIIKQPEVTPEATIDFVNGTLKNLVPGAEYVIENIVYTANAEGTISILENDLTGRSVAVSKKGNGVTTNDSHAQIMEIPARPASPEPPVIRSKTDSSLTLEAKAGLEYTIDGKTWITTSNALYTFDSLKAGTQYTVHTRVKAIAETSFSSISVGTSVETKKSSDEAIDPKEISVITITDTTITIVAVSGQEYRLGTSWVKPSDSTYTWTGLQETTAYKIETRTAETSDTMFSKTISSTVTTYTKLTIPTISVDYWKQALVKLEPGKYTINGREPVTVGKDGLLDVEDYFGRSIKLKRLGSTETKTVDSDAISVAIQSPITAPTKADFDFAKVKSTLHGFVIPAPAANLEFQVLDTEGEPLSVWKSADGEDIVFDGLKDSSPYLIQVSFKPTEASPKSNAYISDTLYTRFYEEVPVAGMDTVTQQLIDLVPGASYLVNYLPYTADANGRIDILDHWVGNQITIVKCGNDTTTVNSLAQELLLPDRVQTVVNVSVQHVTFYDGDNGKISNVTSQMEYSLDKGMTWTAIAVDELVDLSVGEYWIRYRGIKDEKFPGTPYVVLMTVNLELAQYIADIVSQLEQTYDDMSNSKRYTQGQLDQIRVILDDGIQNIKSAFYEKKDAEKAKTAVLENIAQVPCSNTPTADGKMVGDAITDNILLEYPDDCDEVWGNVANSDGLNSGLLFVIEQLSYTDTEALRNQIADAIKDGSIRAFDMSMGADELQKALEYVDLKLGMNITLNENDQAIDQFKGTYTVTILLPNDLQDLSDLNVISVADDGVLSYHKATKIGDYLTFEADHFSIYGIIGADSLAIAKDDILNRISDLYNSLDPKSYSKDNLKAIKVAREDAISAVTAAANVDEVNQAWTTFLLVLQQIPARKSLGWLWILITVLVVLIALMIVCYLVWRVRYYDQNELLRSEFHFWRTKVLLWMWNKDDFVLDGWYHDPDLTDRAEDGFPMPWHGVKLYAKWNPIEILSEEDETESEEPITEAEEEFEETTMLLGAPTEEAATVDDERREDETPDVSQLLEAPAADEIVEETDEIEQIEEILDPETLTEEAEEVDAEKSADAVSDEEPDEKASESDVADELIEEDISIEETEEKPAVIVVGDPIEEGEDEFVNEVDDSYKNTESYQAWLQFADNDTVDESNDDIKIEDGDEVQLFVNEKTGEKYHIRFNLSFRAKMTSLSDEAKLFYQDLKNEFLTYKGVKTRISWKAEAVRKGRETIARFVVRENTLCVFLALDPDEYKDSKYVFESVKDIKAYEAVPMLIRVKSDLSCRKVKELIADIMQPREVKRLDKAPEIDYSYLNDDSSTEARLRAGQLRIWAEGPDNQVCANRAAAATLHYLISPEATAEEAEMLISDEMLEALMPASENILIVADEVGEVSIEQLCKQFFVGDSVDIETMKEKELLASDMTYVKITASSEITKKLTVSAHMFERTAAKMILLTGGDVNIIAE